MINDNYKYSELTDKIFGSAMTFHNKLKSGLPEIYYYRPTIIECGLQELLFRNEVEIPVFNKGVDIGKRYYDIIIDDKVSIEIKAVFLLWITRQFWLTQATI